MCLHSSSFPESSIEELVATCNAFQLTAIELRLVDWQRHGLTARTPPERRQQIASMAIASNIKIVSLGSQLKLGRHLESELNSDLQLCLDCAVPMLRVYLDDLWTNLTVNKVDTNQAMLRSWRSRAAENGILLTFENHSDFASISKLHATIPHESLTWDIGQSIRAQESIQAISDDVLAKVTHVHLKNGKVIEGKWFPTLLTAGVGDIHSVVSRLSAVHYDGYLSLEVDPTLVHAELNQISRWWT
jgi:sugar phosphate isomerase/epimerase